MNKENSIKKTQYSIDKATFILQIHNNTKLNTKKILPEILHIPLYDQCSLEEICEMILLKFNITNVVIPKTLKKSILQSIWQCTRNSKIGTIKLQEESLQYCINNLLSINTPLRIPDINHIYCKSLYIPPHRCVKSDGGCHFNPNTNDT